MNDTSTKDETDLSAAFSAAQASGPAAAAAYADLSRALLEIEAGYSNDPELSPQQQTARRYLVANALQHGFQCWFDCDPARPVFHRWLSPTKKLLGDNPDAVYYGTVVDPGATYMIRGNTMGATYTSFTVESGVEDGNLSSGLVSTLNDSEFEVKRDGSFEIVASAEPQDRNWLKLAPGAGGITTRHYFETERDMAADPTFHIPLWIEPVENPGPAPLMDDAAVAAGIRRVINFVRGTTIDFPEIPEEFMPSWISKEVNKFSCGDNENELIGYAAKDIDYRQTIYDLEPDQALVMKGRWPRCLMGNVVIWNEQLQTPPYIGRKVSFNRRQLKYEEDGSFTIVLSHRDPGVPNWIDTAGMKTGMIFWRYLLPEEEVPNIETELVDVSSLTG
jgi:hypothetical protein